MRERFKVAGSRPSGRCDGLAVPTIFVVAAQIFPSETSGRDVLCVPVCRRRSPIDAEHGVTSPSRDAGQRPAKRGSRITGNIEAAQSRYLERLTRSFFDVFFVIQFRRFCEPGEARRARWSDGATCGRRRDSGRRLRRRSGRPMRSSGVAAVRQAACWRCDNARCPVRRQSSHGRVAAPLPRLNRNRKTGPAQDCPAA